MNISVSKHLEFRFLRLATMRLVCVSQLELGNRYEFFTSLLEIQTCAFVFVSYFSSSVRPSQTTFFVEYSLLENLRTLQWSGASNQVNEVFFCVWLYWTEIRIVSRKVFRFWQRGYDKLNQQKMWRKSLCVGGNNWDENNSKNIDSDCLNVAENSISNFYVQEKWL